VIWKPRTSESVRRRSRTIREPAFCRREAKLTVCNQAEVSYALRPFLPKNQPKKLFMSQHRSLRAASTLGGKRNVLKRFERTALLEKRGQRKTGDKITGLRKTKPEA
jgi:small basic protein (TIGR04137 family)